MILYYVIKEVNDLFDRLFFPLSYPLEHKKINFVFTIVTILSKLTMTFKVKFNFLLKTFQKRTMFNDKGDSKKGIYQIDQGRR